MRLVLRMQHATAAVSFACSSQRAVPGTIDCWFAVAFPACRPLSDNDLLPYASPPAVQFMLSGVCRVNTCIDVACCTSMEGCAGQDSGQCVQE